MIEDRRAEEKEAQEDRERRRRAQGHAKVIVKRD